MRKTILAAFAALALGTVGFASSAGATEDFSRDRGDIVEVSATCNADGTQSVTFIITNTSDEHTATIDELSATIGPIVGASVGDVLLPGASENATITTSGDQTGTVRLSVELEYVVGEEHHFDRHDSDDVQFPGGCEATPPVTIIKEVPGDNVLVPVPEPFPVFVPVAPQIVEQPVIVTQAPTPVVAVSRFTG